jgi:hypothetical protein
MQKIIFDNTSFIKSTILLIVSRSMSEWKKIICVPLRKKPHLPPRRNTIYSSYHDFLNIIILFIHALHNTTIIKFIYLLFISRSYGESKIGHFDPFRPIPTPSSKFKKSFFSQNIITICRLTLCKI